MAKSRDNYQVSGQTLDELTRNLNFLLQRLADRIDKIEGIRGTSSIESNLDMNQNTITELGSGAEDTDAARIADLTSANPEFATVTTTGNADIGGDVSIGGDIEVFDENDQLIHSME